jgi:FkbM family methyltransferase
MYNDASPLNDYKVNSHEQTKTVNMISSNHIPQVGKKKILIAIPCKNDIEADTFKSIYDLEVPEGYETEFQYFYGYAVDQVRNLIAHWVINAYDYLLAIDHDVVFEKDTLKKMLAHDKPLVSGVYRQRLDPPMIEIYDHNMVRMDISNLTGSLQEIGGCGFGCVLVKKEVFASMPYPWFVYHQSLNHNETFSEDLDFCRKARDKGYKLYADSSILCKHIGQRSFEVELPTINPIENKLTQIYNQNWLPTELVEYTNNLNIEEPKVIYDIGSNALEWTRLATNKWKNSRIIAFEAMEDFRSLYSQNNYDYHLGVLSDTDKKLVKFYENPIAPWGNSYYKENENESPKGFEFGESHAVTKVTRTLDAVVKENHWPKPDLIKIDVQGAEMDVLLGAKECLNHCENIIIELQHENYNLGAPMFDEMMSFMNSLGFELVKQIHRKKCDGDYHFKRSSTKPRKAIIIYNENEISKEYLNTAIESCNSVGIQPMPFRGFDAGTIDDLEKIFGFKFGTEMFPMNDPAARATASHFKVWEFIAEQSEPFIILEHDAIMLHDVNLPIPDDRIVALGYKVYDPKSYDHVNAGEPKEIIDINRFSGAHAYIITPKVAKMLLEELKEVGAERAIDNFYFMRKNDECDTESSVKLSVVNPIAALSWVRKSTIWEETPDSFNYNMVESFIRNYKP